MRYLFLDESGSHNLAVHDPQYPVFVLGGVIVADAETLGRIESGVRAFKHRTLGDADAVLHTADIVRNRGAFAGLADPTARQRFTGALNDLIARLEFKVVACAVLKDAYRAKYGPLAIDPYLFSLGILVERFCFEIGNKGDVGRVEAERRGPQLDRELRVAWQALTLSGTSYVPRAMIVKRVEGLSLRSKSAANAGLELADLVVSPIGRAVIGKPERADYHIVRSKFRTTKDGRHEGAGLVVLPKEAGRGPLRSSRPRK